LPVGKRDKYLRIFKGTAQGTVLCACSTFGLTQGTVPCVTPTTTWIGFGITVATTVFLSAHNNKVNTYKTMILETILNGNESDLYFELSSIILITTTLFGESENKELLNSIIFEEVEGLV